MVAERRRIAERVRQELTIAGLPTLLAGFDPRADVSGVVIEVDDGDDSAGGVILHWQCSRALTDQMVTAVAERRTDDSAIWYAGAVKKAMNAALVQILTAAGFTVVDNPNGMHMLSLNVRAGPGPEVPLAWETASGTV